MYKLPKRKRTVRKRKPIPQHTSSKLEGAPKLSRSIDSLDTKQKAPEIKRSHTTLGITELEKKSTPKNQSPSVHKRQTSTQMPRTTSWLQLAGQFFGIKTNQPNAEDKRKTVAVDKNIEKRQNHLSKSLPVDGKPVEKLVGDRQKGGIRKNASFDYLKQGKSISPFSSDDEEENSYLYEVDTSGYQQSPVPNLESTSNETSSEKDSQDLENDPGPIVVQKFETEDTPILKTTVWTSNGNILVRAGYNGKLDVWDIEGGDLVEDFSLTKSEQIKETQENGKSQQTTSVESSTTAQQKTSEEIDSVEKSPSSAAQTNSIDEEPKDISVQFGTPSSMNECAIQLTFFRYNIKCGMAQGFHF